jgi:heparosan-N-sulfate-glucuronate 5-epimerase
MAFANRIHYYRRIFSAYLLPGKSQLTFWHETPEMNPHLRTDQLGQYYMTFAAKADYSGHYDPNGIPMLDYHGKIGRQYNPIAVAQWGLGNYNLFRRTGQAARREKLVRCADWLLANLDQNPQGVWVWSHHFDWEYRDTLRAPWYSGLAQGQGISLLLRAHLETGDANYLGAARDAFLAFERPLKDGGVAFSDARGDLWIEEYLVQPPTHILNGFIWALWGIYDMFLVTGESAHRALFERGVKTLERNLEGYDTRFWSLYEQSGTRLKMLASPFYHRLHVVQLQIMHRLTGAEVFARFARRWEGYQRSRLGRTRAILYKGAFKLLYY